MKNIPFILKWIDKIEAHAYAWVRKKLVVSIDATSVIRKLEWYTSGKFPTPWPSTQYGIWAPRVCRLIMTSLNHLLFL